MKNFERSASTKLLLTLLFKIVDENCYNINTDPAGYAFSNLVIHRQSYTDNLVNVSSNCPGIKTKQHENNDTVSDMKILYI